MTIEIAIAFVAGNLTGAFAAYKGQPFVARVKAAWAVLFPKP